MKIAVELDPPAGNAAGDALAFLADGARALARAGADFITMADNPRAAPRGDSVSLAALVAAVSRVPVVPHLTARDRNELAIRSALLALDIAGVHEIIAVTGDPLRGGGHDESRRKISRATDLCAADLAALISKWNIEENLFSRPFAVTAALNVNARNFDAELERARRKAERGVRRFFTQPVLSEVAARNAERARRSLGLEVYGGILPIVSERNAQFLATEVPGIRVSDELVRRYRGLDKEDAARAAVSLSLEFAHELRRFADGIYLITPFKRVDIVTEIVAGIVAGEQAKALETERHSRTHVEVAG